MNNNVKIDMDNLKKLAPICLVSASVQGWESFGLLAFI
jgi:hypothetical protein